ncbi:MAG: helix-turn-helix domain-containing protein [Desulfatiglandales bacterium]
MAQIAGLFQTAKLIRKLYAGHDRVHTGICMSDTELQKGQPGKGEEREPGNREARGLGYFFRHERERQGLDPEQIAEVTRLRRHIIEALETEAWDNLPPPVFVRGFVRTYARALALDEEEAVGLFEETFGPGTVEPVPLTQPRRNRAGRLVLLSLFLVLAGAAVYIFLSGRFVPPGRETPSEIKGAARDSAAEGEKEDTERGSVLKERPGTMAPRLDERPVPVPEVEPRADRDEALRGQPVPDRLPPAETPLPESEPEFRSGETEAHVRSPEKPPDGQGGSGPSEILQVEENILRVTVIERTWMKIYVDDEDPREYIFRPGTQPQWKARNGFNLVIGNAAGIKLEFNGKRIENLGNTGQVVRLSFPENFRAEKYED